MFDNLNKEAEAKLSDALRGLADAKDLIGKNA